MLYKNMDFTFGIITTTNQEDNILKIIKSIEKQKIDNYEIIIVGDCNLERKNTTVILFDENVKNMWITRKKNIISEKAKYENVVYLHDYIVFEDGWYGGHLKKGNDFEVRMDKIINLDNTRFRDWVIWPHNNNEMDGFIGRDCLIPYDLTHLSKYMYISGSYWVSKKKFMMDNPLNEILGWGDGEDVEWSIRIREKIKFDMNERSCVKLLKYKYPVFNITPVEKIDILKKNY